MWVRNPVCQQLSSSHLRKASGQEPRYVLSANNAMPSLSGSPERNRERRLAVFYWEMKVCVNRTDLGNLASQFSSVAQSCLTLCNPMDCSMPGFPVHYQLPELAQTHVLQIGDAIQPPHPHLLLLLPSIFPSIMVFSNESVLHIRWPKYWSFSFSISPSNEYPGLISLGLTGLISAVQGTLKSFLQRHGSKASILRHSAFLMVQLSHPYMTTRKTIALTKPTFVDKVMSLLFICCLDWS